MHQPTQRNNERGAVAVEFALVLPLLVLVVAGIIQFGIAYNAKLTLNHAVREGGRAATLSGATTESVETRVLDSAKGLGLQRADVTAVACTVGTAGDTLEVSAEHELALNLAILRLPPLTLSATAAVRCPGA